MSLGMSLSRYPSTPPTKSGPSLAWATFVCRFSAIPRDHVRRGCLPRLLEPGALHRVCILYTSLVPQRRAPCAVDLVASHPLCSDRSFQIYLDNHLQSDCCFVELLLLPRLTRLFRSRRPLGISDILLPHHLVFSAQPSRHIRSRHQAPGKPSLLHQNRRPSRRNRTSADICTSLPSLPESKKHLHQDSPTPRT